MPRRTVLLALTSSHQGFIRGIIHYAREHNWHLVTDMIYNGKIPIGWQGDGIISYFGYRKDLVAFILASGLPSVEVSMLRPEIPLPRVEGDNKMIGRLAAEHFLERGYSNFAWAPLMDDNLNAERFEGFTSVLSKKGPACFTLPPADSFLAQESTRDWGSRRKLLIQKLKSFPKPLGVFCFNDRVAADIIDACNAAGLLVPESVAVLGVDNDEMICESIPIPLSSVCHDMFGVAFEAAALLDRLMSGGKPPKKVKIVPPKGVVTRRSTDILALDNLQIARALRYIRQYYTSPLLSVENVVAATDLSRRSLEKAFFKELKITIHDEIIQLRLKKAKELLSNSAMTVVEISSTCGFSRPNHLFRSFRKLVGTSPRSYRIANSL